MKMEELAASLGISIRTKPMPMPPGVLAAVIALNPDGSINFKSSCILKEEKTPRKTKSK